MPGTPVNPETVLLEKQQTAALLQVHAINQSIAAERARDNKAGVAAMLPLYVSWLATLRAINAKLDSRMDMSAFDRFVLSTGNYVKAVKDAVPDVASDIAMTIVKAVLPFALMYAAFLYLTRKGA